MRRPPGVPRRAGPGPDCPLPGDSEDISRCEAPWTSRLAVIIQMKDEEKGRAVAPPWRSHAGRRPQARWAISHAGEQPRTCSLSRNGFVLPFEDSFSLVSDVTLPLASLSRPLGLVLQTSSRTEEIKPAGNGGEEVSGRAGVPRLLADGGSSGSPSQEAPRGPEAPRGLPLTHRARPQTEPRLLRLPIIHL